VRIDSQPGILHERDYHLANVMFLRDGPEIAAIVDLGAHLSAIHSWICAGMLATLPRPIRPHWDSVRLRLPGMDSDFS